MLRKFILFFIAVFGFLAISHQPAAAALMPIETKTPESLKKDYENGTLKILIVPGHDNQDFGTEFKDTREADLNLKLAKHLDEFLRKDRHIQVTTTRDLQTGEYNAELAKYFVEEEDLIASFITEVSRIMRSALGSGQINKTTSIVSHNKAKSRIVQKLYGINKWANENNMDLVLHIHFNDDGDRRYNRSGEYAGFTIYVPEKQFSGSRASARVASAVFSKLSENFGVSTLRGESRGVVEDQDLIAVGANGSLDAAALLIEYGYIYEPQFTRQGIRDSMMRELAFQTYMGIEKYFGKDNLNEDTTLLPYVWKNILRQGMKGSRDVLALQAALKAEGLFPPARKTLAECPLNGNFGECTGSAVKAFQEKYADEILKPAKLTRGNGILGLKTMRKLNILYNPQ